MKHFKFVVLWLVPYTAGVISSGFYGYIKYIAILVICGVFLILLNKFTSGIK